MLMTLALTWTCRLATPCHALSALVPTEKRYWRTSARPICFLRWYHL